jgi:phosphatidylethanolamine/phosphatidyl-N-methylethanolamine N-methyltransferase
MPPRAWVLQWWATVTVTNEFNQAVYRRLATIYDVAFGPILQSGRERAIRAIPADRDLAVLEAGIGTALTVAAYPAGCRVTGIDLSAEMLAQARRRVSKLGVAGRVNLVRADAARLPFDDGAFDAVVAPYVLSVVSDPVRVGRELGRVCRPDGRVVLLNHFGSESATGAAIDRWLSPLTSHVGFRTDLRLKPLLREAGLKPLSIQAVNVPPMWTLVLCVKDQSLPFGDRKQ